MTLSNTTEALGASNNSTIVPDVSLLIIVIGLMFCMTFCCLCLLCHRTSEFQICGIHFVADTDPAEREPTMEELNEIHEVLPLTPTEGPQYPALDIEGMLKSDPPPPAYTEAKAMPRSTSFRWKFKSTKKRRNSSSASGKQNSFLSSFGPPRLSFRRSQSLNQQRPQLVSSDSEIKCNTIEINPHDSLEDSSLLGFRSIDDSCSPGNDSKKLVVELDATPTTPESTGSANDVSKSS